MKHSHRNSLLITILVVVTVITVGGALGFYYFESGQNDTHYSLWDSFWWAMVTITTIGYGDIYPKTVGGRLIAIFLMFTGIGTLGISTAAIAAYFIKTDQLQVLRLRKLRDHVIICGLGDKGLLLARAFQAQGFPVVVIEQNENNDFIQPCREQGAIVVVGNATEPEVLSLARVEEAKHLIAVCGNDGANAEIAAHAHAEVAERAGRVLTCSIHIVNPELWYLLRKWEVDTSRSFRMQFFNAFDIGARALLDAYPPFDDTPLEIKPEVKPEAVKPEAKTKTENDEPPADSQATAQDFTKSGTPPHILVVGGGRLGQSLAVHAARRWRDRFPTMSDSRTTKDVIPAAQKLRITMVDKDTVQIREFLHLRHPELEQVCHLEGHPFDITSPEFHRASFLFDKQGNCHVSHVYVCIDDDAVGLSAALSIHHRIGRHGVTIVVRMTQDAGLTTLLKGIGDEDGRFGALRAVGLLERTCQPDLVLGGTNEMLARALHNKYVNDQEALGQTPQTNPLLLPWDDLPEDTKESNRDQAHDVSTKLKAIHCDVVPLTDWDAAAFTFTPEEVELMAKMEHERWSAERRQHGWTYGPRDPQRKTNPNLVPWDELTDDTKVFNRSAVSEIPFVLAQAGFQIYRL